MKTKIKKPKLLMSFSRPIQWYHSHADPIWPDGTFKTLHTAGHIQSYLSRCNWPFNTFILFRMSRSLTGMWQSSRETIWNRTASTLGDTFFNHVLQAWTTILRIHNHMARIVCCNSVRTLLVQYCTGEFFGLKILKLSQNIYSFYFLTNLVNIAFGNLGI